MNYDIYQLMDPGDAQAMRDAIMAMEWYPGQARTKEATTHYKSNYELPRENAQVMTLAIQLRNMLQRNSDVQKDHLVNKFMTPKFNRYDAESEMTYKRHGDSALMGGKIRTDLACTIFLTKPEDYDGGELVIEDSTGKEWGFKPDQGQCIIYPCYNPHWVNPVTRGSRVSAITWIESKFRNYEQRELIRRFGKVLRDIEEKDGYSDNFTSLAGIMSKLTRMWVEYDTP